ncbi:hypothetical protein BRADO4367 [Bradyrhizobium sp. ORS 278]|uniref:hypothetical protein n=1 Tax=Bradyrhizobium sp. (strain ORS 278) TaxID=114615 RepID=UPI000150814A|nr:hypothetical protein BRADO4367 [Bradyrhizobium sp. ORS 278]
MPTAFVIEVFNRTAGIVTADERGFSFFSPRAHSTAWKGNPSHRRAMPNVPPVRSSSAAADARGGGHFARAATAAARA